MNQEEDRGPAARPAPWHRLTGCAGGAGGGDDKVLRIAMGSPGEAQIRVWDDVAAQFEEANEG